MEEKQKLKRAISMPQLIFYGLGTMIGGGIYALTGKVAGMAGLYAPISFVLSAMLAMLSAFSYAELSTRYPMSAGAAHYVRAAFDKKTLTLAIGWLLIFTGIVSAAALSNATAGFIHDLAGFSQPTTMVVLIVMMGAIAAWGISESVWVVVLITLVEIGGLMLIILSSGEAFGEAGARWREFFPSDITNIAVWSGILGGSFIAFYAFIGFEDLVNVAEEVKNVEHVMPWTIIICVMVTMVLYILVVVAATMTVPMDILAASKTPMATIIEHGKSGIPAEALSVISLLATINGALVQIVMGSRVLFGLFRAGESKNFAKNLGAVHPRTQTPLYATGLVVILTLAFALFFDLIVLAKIASAVILIIFVTINAALLKIKLDSGSGVGARFTVPVFVPVLGLCASLALLAYELNKYLP
jgi:APA family basic amino acid/polyamine antiporter